MQNAAQYEEDNVIVETINGQEVLMSPRPATPHNRVASNIHGIFWQFLRGKRCEVFFEPDVFLDEANNFVPDVAVVCDKNKIKHNGIHGAPDLVVEVLSPSTLNRDRSVKKDTYEKAGVKEYWIADPLAKSIEVYHLREGRFALDHAYAVFREDEWARMTEEDRAAARLFVKVSLYDDLLVDVREVFGAWEEQL